MTEQPRKPRGSGSEQSGRSPGQPRTGPAANRPSQPQSPAPKAPAPKAPAPKAPAGELPLAASDTTGVLNRLKTGRRPQKWLPAVAAALVLLALSGWWLFLRGGPPAAPPPGDGQPVAEQDPQAQPVALGPHPPRKPVTLTVKTAEPGFLVLVDGEPVRDDAGNLLKTPCEVTVERGKHLIQMARKGWNDPGVDQEFLESTTLQAEPEYQPFEVVSKMFDAPYLMAEVGQPLKLKTLSLPNGVQDPFVSTDGRTIWYAASGPEGRGVYMATRPTKYDEWGPPALLLLSRGSDIPSSPSADADQDLIVYSFPDKPGRLWGLIRLPDQETYDDKKYLLNTEERGDPSWPVVQLSADALRLYFVSYRGDQATTYMAERDQRDYDFRRYDKFDLPGNHPCLSADELRQYAFNGKQLQRASRKKITDNFGTLTTVAEVQLPDYQRHAQRRQFWVSDDEQWLYYSPQPEQGGDLFVVRLSQGPHYGTRNVGKQLKVEAPAPKPTKPKPSPPKPMPVAQAPTTPAGEKLPETFEAYRKRWEELLRERDWQGAHEWVAAQQKNPALQGLPDLWRWDEAEVQLLEKLWQEVEQAFAALMPGDKMRLGANTWDVTASQDGRITLELRGKQQEKTAADLTQADAIWLLDQKHDKDDQDLQYRVGVWLYYAGPSYAMTAKTRLQRSGEQGDAFIELQAQRLLKLTERELNEQHLSVALQRIDQLLAEYPQSKSARQAEQHRDQIYTFIKWDVRQPQQWKQTADGVYAAGPNKRPGALLVSPQVMDSFILTCEWQTTTRTGQGGVYFNYPGSGKPLDTAFQVHAANDAGIPADKYCTGSLFNLIPPQVNAAKPGGEWNTMRVQFNGDTVVVHVNGQKVLETIASDPEIPKRGYVALDGELGGISYRKILLVEGPAPFKPAPAMKDEAAE